jgi:recombination protein RecA
MPTAALHDLLHASQVWRSTTPATAAWTLANLAGRYVELAARGPAARLTIAGQLIREAQLAREPAAWITSRGSSFHPPDFAGNGVDLEALVVVRVPAAPAQLRAAETLLRSGAFAVVVVDLESMTPPHAVALATQTRLVGLAQHHGTLLLCLTPQDDASPHALSSLRAEASLHAAGGGMFTSRVLVTKDKRAAPGWEHTLSCRGPSAF